MNADIASGTELDRIGALYGIERSMYPESDSDYRKKVILAIVTKKADKMNYKKDYSLLRPFDLEAAKAGEPICDRLRPGLFAKFISHFPDVVAHERVLIQLEKGLLLCFENGESHGYGSIYFAMAPLAWVEGRPVYKGDVLYLQKTGSSIIADGAAKNSSQQECVVSDFYSPHDEMWWPIVGLTWQKPKVKKSGWRIVAKDTLNYSKEEAEIRATLVTNSVAVYGEWEE